MTLDEALNELGIDHDSDAEEARRAYLRLLKKRKPEVDRDGFMRLREAYEITKPYFAQIEMFRAIEKAASVEQASVDGAAELVRVETPAGVVWVQRNPNQDKLSEVEDKPPVESIVTAPESPVERALELEDAPVEALHVELDAQAPAEPEVEVVAKALDAEPAEPSIDELIADGKFKKAARLMGNQYREAVQQGTIDVNVPSPHQAVLLLLRLHEKNHFELARVLEKEFAEWLSATGASVRFMAGSVGVMWLMVRELSALSNKFPKELREGIAKAVIAEKLDDAQRRAGWFQMRDPLRARDAALDLHAHAPTLAKLLGDTLAPIERRPAPVRSGSSGSRGGWWIGGILIAALNLFRLLGSSSMSTPNSYQGQADPGAYARPTPPLPPEFNASPKPIATLGVLDAGSAVDNSVKMDKATRDKLVRVAQVIEAAAEKATKLEEIWVVQRTRYVRSALETGSCDRASAEMFGFYTDVHILKSPLRETLIPNVTYLDEMFRAACATGSAEKPLLDGGPKKKP